MSFNYTDIINATRDTNAYNPVAVSGWEGSAIAALTIAGLILAIVYGISRVLNNEKMKAWAISEAGQFVASGLIIGSLAAIITFLASISFAVSGSSDVFGFAINYIDRLESKAFSLMNVIFAVTAFIGLIKNAGIQIVVQITPLAGLEGIFKVFNDMFSQLFTLIMLGEVQKSLLYFCKATMLQLFLPIGVILRTFPFTRAIGGFIMALAIGMAIVFPLTYVLDSHALSQLHTANDQYIEDTAAILKEKTDFASKNMWESPDKFFAFIGSVASEVSFDKLGKTGAIIQWGISNLIVSLFLLPLINLIITILFILQLSSVLGSEVNFSFVKRL